MKEINHIIADILQMLNYYIKEGISTEDINNICHNYIIKYKGIPACLNYNGFPKSICTSINDVACHGIPSPNCILKKGDIINIDIGIYKNGLYGDSSKMYLIEPVNKNAKNLCYIAQQSLYKAIKILKDNIPINLIGYTIENYIKTKSNYSIVKNYCGHGIGNKFHKLPNILHYKNNNNQLLKNGMIITIEPIINMGSNITYIDKDNWTVKTIDNKLSAQYEHSILITKNGYQILSLREEEYKYF